MHYMMKRKMYHKKYRAMMARRKGETIKRSASGMYYCKKY